MGVDPRLEWVQRNRSKKRRDRRAGDVLADMARRGRRTDADALRATVSTIAGVVDRVFLAHCRIATVSATTLVINVDQATMVGSMRARWRDTLCARLRAMDRWRGDMTVVFRYGKTGVVIGA